MQSYWKNERRQIERKKEGERREREKEREREREREKERERDINIPVIEVQDERVSAKERSCILFPLINNSLIFSCIAKGEISSSKLYERERDSRWVNAPMPSISRKSQEFNESKIRDLKM